MFGRGLPKSKFTALAEFKSVDVGDDLFPAKFSFPQTKRCSPSLLHLYFHGKCLHELHSLVFQDVHNSVSPCHVHDESIHLHLFCIPSVWRSSVSFSFKTLISRTLISYIVHASGQTLSILHLLMMIIAYTLFACP